MTPLICCNCFNKADEETINFMEWYLSGETTDFWLMAKLFSPAEAALTLIVNFM
jgi:ferritin